MTRVLLSFGAWAGGLSGGDRHLLEVASRWRAHVQIAAVAPVGADAIYGPLLPDVRFTPLWPGELREGAGLAAQYVARAGRALRTRYRADVVVGASHFLPDAAMVNAGARGGALGVGYVYHLIGERRDRSPRTLWSKADERLGLALLRDRAGVVFTSNLEAAAQLRRVGFAPHHTGVGLDVGAQPRAHPSDAPPVAVFLARLVASKGLLDAVRAIAAARRSVPGARLTVLGSGPQRAEAERLAVQLGCAEAIDWLGFVSEQRKREVLGAARMLIAPSYEEGWGITVAEAMACGLPVLAYRLATLDEVFGDGYRGVRCGDVDGLASAMAQLLSDDGVARSLGERGRAHVQRYDLDAIAERELDVILRARTG